MYMNSVAEFPFNFYGPSQKHNFFQNLFEVNGPYPGKWHDFVLALLYLFECLNA